MTEGTAAQGGIVGLILRIIERLNAVPYTLLALPLRVAVAYVFWNSAMVKLTSWSTTIMLFESEYPLPFLPPVPAAYLATAVELSMPVLLVLGLGVRPAAAVLLGMTAVIQIFVYPMAWPTHIQWAAMLLVLLCRGGGVLSLDHLIRRRFLGSGGDARF